MKDTETKLKFSVQDLLKAQKLLEGISDALAETTAITTLSILPIEAFDKPLVAALEGICLNLARSFEAMGKCRARLATVIDTELERLAALDGKEPALHAGEPDMPEIDPGALKDLSLKTTD